MPRRVFRLLGFIGFLGLFLSAGPAAPAVQLQATQPEGPAMWRLATDGATVYFLGSFHLLPPSVKWHDVRVDQAMREAKEVAFEVDMRETEKPAAAQMILKRAFLPKGRTLKQEVSADTYVHLEDAVSHLPVQMDVIARAKPWFAATALVLGYMTSQGADPHSGVDTVLTQEAAAAGKRIVGFETVERQVDVMDSLSQEDPDFVLMDAIRFVDDPRGLLAHTVDAWRTGDTEDLDHLMREDLDDMRGAYDRFIVDRNKAWVPQVEEMIHEGGTYFVVVGAGHLVGDDSVIALLRRKGYFIERF